METIQAGRKAADSAHKGAIDLSKLINPEPIGAEEIARVLEELEAEAGLDDIPVAQSKPARRRA
jgi:hypothetical protein